MTAFPEFDRSWWLATYPEVGRRLCRVARTVPRSGLLRTYSGGIVRPRETSENDVRIKSFEIEGLLGREDTLSHDLSSDFAIFTGRNGSGKTSVLKLLWSIISGNILIGLDEVPFQTVKVVTDEYECKVHRLGRRTCKVDFISGSDRDPLRIFQIPTVT
jgi:hypothetical protein